MKRTPINSEIFTRAVDNILTQDGLQKKLNRGTALRIKFGVDVTASTLHIGNAVNLWKMRELQEYGHKIIFLVGDFTTRIGDPTGRLEVRTGSLKDVDRWAENFIKQVGEILRTDKKVFEVRKNSEWYGKMKADEFLKLLGLFTHAQLIERDMFQKRMKERREILVPELLYPILQGYDSVMLKSDLTIIGSDQLFNEGIGRFLQEKFGQEPQVLITTTITPGIDGGPKMSKSVGNFIGLADTAQDKFGKAMRILDSLIISYFEVYTDVPLTEVRQWEEDLKNGKNPMGAKLFFAEALVRRYHGEKAAKKARENFVEIFSKKNLVDLPTANLAPGAYLIIELLLKLKLASSKSEARRLLQQRAIEVDNQVIDSPATRINVQQGSVFRVGKKRFLRIQ